MTQRLALVLLVVFVLSQALDLVHLFKHQADGDGDHCEICSVAAHFGNSPLPALAETPDTAPIAYVFYKEVFQPVSLSSPATYTSRAPPVNA